MTQAATPNAAAGATESRSFPELRTRRTRIPLVRGMGEARIFHGRPARKNGAGSHALCDPVPAAQRDGHAAHGPRLQPDHHGRPGPLPPHVGQRHRVHSGTDHAGIATQIVVERQLDAQKVSRHDLGREKFVEKVWEWKEKSGSTITGQVRRLGASADWPREYFTMDERTSRGVVETFVRLHKQGLIYRGKRLVNWDPNC